MASIPTNVNPYRFQSVTMLDVTPEQTPFARALLALISERGWSQRRIARAMGLSHPQIRAYLEGEQEPGFFKVVALAEEAGVSLDWIAGREARLPQIEVDGERYVPASELGVGGAASETAGVVLGRADETAARARARLAGGEAPEERHPPAG